MPEFRKRCIKCNHEFDREHKVCPRCQGDDWRWIDAKGRFRDFFHETLLKRTIRDARLRRIRKLERCAA